MQRFGKRLKKSREASGMSQELLARRVGIHRTSIHRWESGVDIPSGRVIGLLAEALNVGARYLLGLRSTPEVGLYPDHRGRRLLQVYEELSHNGRSGLLEIAEDMLRAQQAHGPKIEA